jgi:hypothetical protein
MEIRTRPVDIPVTRPLGEFAQGGDSQIEAAVKEAIRPSTKTVMARRKLSAGGVTRCPSELRN